MSVALAAMGGGGSAGGGGGGGGGGPNSRLYRSVATGLLLSGPAAAGMAGMEPAPSASASGGGGDGGGGGSGAGGDANTSRPLLGAKYKYDRLNLTISHNTASTASHAGRSACDVQVDAQPC